MGAEYDAHGGPVRDAPVHDVVPVHGAPVHDVAPVYRDAPVHDEFEHDAPVDVVQDDGAHGAPDGALYAPVCDDLLVKQNQKLDQNHQIGITVCFPQTHS